jgi:hypothetical protein
MQRSKHSLPIAIALAVMIIGFDGLTSVALADDPPKSYRRYDELGRFDDTTREDREGNLRFYNEKGEYEGYAQQKRDGSWRSYDEKGRFKGTIREDPE